MKRPKSEKEIKQFRKQVTDTIENVRDNLFDAKHYAGQVKALLQEKDDWPIEIDEVYTRFCCEADNLMGRFKKIDWEIQIQQAKEEE